MSVYSHRPRAGAPERRQKATCSKALSNAAVKRKRPTDLEFRRRRNSHKTVNTPTGRRVQDNRKGVYSGSQGRMSQNILRAPKGARHSCEVVSPLTDPLVHWPEGAHPILGEQRQVIVQTKERCTCSHYQLYRRALWAPRRRSKPRHVT